MKHITDPTELIIGREYWLVAKENNTSGWEPKVSKLLDENGRKFFEFRMWVEPDNNQAMDHWDIFGPIPESVMPDFEALKAAGQNGISTEINVDALSNYIRAVDGQHAMGAGILAEHICDWIVGKSICASLLDGMPVFQEPKHGIRNNRLYNRNSNEFIPVDEPVFIFRARDKIAVQALLHYITLCTRYIGAEHDHVKAIRMRIAEFEKFARDHQDRMKFPDTVLWPNFVAATK